MTELTLSIRSQFSLQLNCYEMLWLYKDKSRLQDIPQNFYCNYPKNSLSWEFSISINIELVSFNLLLFMLKIETSTGGTNSMPFRIFRRNHLRSTSRIICGSGSFEVQFGDHFWSGDHLRRCEPWLILRRLVAFPTEALQRQDCR